MKRKKKDFVLYAPRPRLEPLPRIPYIKLPSANSSFLPAPKPIHNIRSKKPRHKKPRRRKPYVVPKAHSVNNSDVVGWPNTVDTGYNQIGISPGSNSTHTSAWLVAGTRTRSGISNPHWKDQTRLGINATTPMSAVDIIDDRSPWSGYSIGIETINGQLYRKWSYSGWGQPSYGVPIPNVAPAGIVTDVQNRCIRRFINEVSEAQSSDNLTGRSIKHFKHDVHSTFHPMAGIREKLSSYLTSLEKVPYGKLKSSSLYSTITQAYLEFKFGVEPFVDDITAIVTDMCIKDRKRNPSVPVKASAHKTYTGTSSPTAITGLTGDMSPFQLSYGKQITSTYYMRLKGAVRTGVNDDGRLGLVQDNKLLPKDWLPTAFSILPYAWMVNYFTNIRDIIDAACFRYSDLVWGCQTTRDSTVYSFGNVYFGLPNPFFTPSHVFNISSVCTGGSATIEVRTVSRVAISPASLLPQFTFSIPVTPTPWVNMMAAFSPRIFSLSSKLFK